MNYYPNSDQPNYLKLECPECGAPIEVTHDKQAICPYCNQTFLLDEAEGLIVNVNVDYGKSKELSKTIKVILITLALVIANSSIICLALFLVNYDAIRSNYSSSDYDDGVVYSKVCQNLCTDIFDKPYEEITSEEFASIRYIKYNTDRLASTGDWMHIIEYSFTDYQDCESEEEFQSTVKTWTCQGVSQYQYDEKTLNFSKLTGLTRISMAGFRDHYNFDSFSKSADIRYVTTSFDQIKAREIQKFVNPENIETLEYQARTNIEGIKDFPKLKNLQVDIYLTDEFDISEIEHCTTLESLTINNYTSSYIGLEKIGELNELKSLSLPQLYLHECDFISKLNNLEQLTIQIDAEFPGTEVFGDLKKLKTLYLSEYGCVPARDIRHLQNVTNLKLSVNTHEAFNALAKLPNLTTLDVHMEVPEPRTEPWSSTTTLDISRLASIPNLEYLHIQPEAVSITENLYIYGLETLLNDSKLKGLYLNEQKSSTLPSSLSTFTLCIDKDAIHTNDTLQRLQFVSASFKDIHAENTVPLDFIACFPNLEYMVADDCGIEDISFVTSLPNLKYCSFTHNNLQDFTPLNQCNYLEVVALYENPNETPELSDEIVCLTDGAGNANLTEYLMGIEIEVGYIKRQEPEEDE